MPEQLVPLSLRISRARDKAAHLLPKLQLRHPSLPRAKRRQLLPQVYQTPTLQLLQEAMMPGRRTPQRIDERLVSQYRRTIQTPQRQCHLQERTVPRTARRFHPARMRPVDQYREPVDPMVWLQRQAPTDLTPVLVAAAAAAVVAVQRAPV